MEPSKALNILWDVNPHLNSIINFDDIKQKLQTQWILEQSHIEMQFALFKSFFLLLYFFFKILNSRHEINVQMLQEKQASFECKETQTNVAGEEQTSPAIQSYFHLCKSFVHQMGLLSWEKRQSFNILKKTPQLLRELKSLDDQTWFVFNLIFPPFNKLINFFVSFKLKKPRNT